MQSPRRHTPQMCRPRMGRRCFLLTCLAGVVGGRPPVAEAQQPGRVHRIGFLRNGLPPATFIDGFRQGLREAGYIEGQSASIDYALAESAAQLPAVAAELVRRKVDVIIASGTPSVPAAKDATSTIPIVFIASIDPVGTGVVASLARPGGNITGLAGVHADLMGKRLEIVRETVPKLSRVALLSHAANPGNAQYVKQAQDAARTLGVQLLLVAVRDASDFERVFSEARGAGAMIQLDDVIFTSHRKQIVELSIRSQLPVMYGFREFVDAGGLMAYGPDFPDLYRRAAFLVDRILKGTKPADLPIEQPTKFELVINLKAAKALGLTVPPSLLLRADQVIDQ